MTRNKSGYPAAYFGELRRQDVFDPALKHYPAAYVKGPSHDRDMARELEVARAPLLRRAVAAIAESAREHVILRGSIALAAWFPGRARRPHDIDLVVRDPMCKPDDSRARDLIAALHGAVGHALDAAGIELHADQIALDEIWTYERAEGRRLSFPWTLPWKYGAPIRDVVQIDLVFNEPILVEPRLEPIEREARETGYRDAPAVPSLWFASRPESLVWKLLWLDSDMHPQAKDVYDAVLLAEHTPFSPELARAVFAAKGGRFDGLGFLDPGSRSSVGLEWRSFAQEYPELATDDPIAMIARLAALLRGDSV